MLTYRDSRITGMPDQIVSDLVFQLIASILNTFQQTDLRPVMQGLVSEPFLTAVRRSRMFAALAKVVLHRYLRINQLSNT